MDWDHWQTRKCIAVREASQCRIRLRPNGLKNLVQHLPVLRRNTDMGTEGPALAHAEDDRTQLDAMRTSPNMIATLLMGCIRE